MKVLFPLALFYPSKLGGPANTIYWLSKALVKNGVEVTVVTSSNYIKDESIRLDSWIYLDGVKVRYCTSKGKLPLGIIWHSLKEIRKNDIVVFSSICFLPNFFILLYSIICGIRIVWSPRGELFDFAVKNNKLKIYYFKLLKFFIGHKVVFHATSNEEKIFIDKYFPKSNVVVIPNYIEVPLMQEREKNSIQYLLYVGRIAPIKALGNLIEGLARSKSFLESDFIFNIVGSVEEQFKTYYKELKDLIDKLNLSNKVFFIGAKYGVEKYQCFANAYFTFLVSESENFGNVVVESLSQGTPVVASKGTPWKILDEHQAGFWIDNTPDDISECINKILNMSTVDYLEVRKKAFNLVETFDVYSNISEWLNLFSFEKK